MAFNNQGALQTGMAGAATGASIGGPWGAAIGGIAGGLLGGFMDDGSGAYAEQERLIQQTLDELEGIPLPELEKIAYENPEWLNDLVASKAADTQMNQIAVDPRLKNEQMAALSALDELVEGGGMTAMDRANLNRIQNDAATADRGRREAILQNMNQRGMSGSGLELLSQLQSSQAATDRASQQGLDIAGMAQQRALDAILQSGNLAGAMRGQEFGEQAQIAQAQDAINRFNTANQMAANQFNVAGRQDIANQGVDLRNRATQYNAGLAQQNYENQMNKAAAAAAARGQNIGMIGQKRAEDLQTQGNTLGSMIQVGTAIAQNRPKTTTVQTPQPQAQPQPQPTQAPLVDPNDRRKRMGF